jgi:hypothetical protein
MPGDVIEPPKVLLLDLAKPADEIEVCRLSSLEDGLIAPLNFSPDDHVLAVSVQYWFFGDQWYKPFVRWLLDPDRPIRFYGVDSGRCTARLPGNVGTRVIFAPGSRSVISCVPSFHPMAMTPDGKPVILTRDFPIRVYDDRLPAPVPAILAWSLLPTAGVALLGALLRLSRSWRRRDRIPDRASVGSIGPDGGSGADDPPIG